MTGDNHGHHQPTQHQQNPRIPLEGGPSSSSPEAASTSSSDDVRAPSQPSAPATTASRVGGSVICFGSLAVALALCGLAGLLVSWTYYSDGGGGGWGPHRPRGNRGDELVWLREARRRNDSSVDDSEPHYATGRPKVPEPRLKVEDERNGTISPGDGSGLTRRYGSFKEFASEQSAKGGSVETLGVPVVASSKGRQASRSIPVAIIIGVQKGGTQNLRTHLLTHSLLSGYKGKEAHFFDRHFESTLHAPRRGLEWPGDGRDNERSTKAVGDVLSAYANRSMEAMSPNDRDTMAGVDSTPVYVFHPLVPYRIKMVLPRAKFVLLLRDPTERYFSHLRMTMCGSKRGESFSEAEERLRTYFHNPGAEGAKKYVKEGEAKYEPYTPLCRGENATPADLNRCWEDQLTHHPLHRGLYADQLERWFRAFDREQIMIVDSGEMFTDFTGTLHRVANHFGLPPHDFEYNSRHQHSSGSCERRRPELFAKGARYDKMLEDEKYFREWYRPHNERLFALLGLEMPWK